RLLDRQTPLDLRHGPLRKTDLPLQPGDHQSRSRDEEDGGDGQGVSLVGLPEDRDGGKGGEQTAERQGEESSPQAGEVRGGTVETVGRHTPKSSSIVTGMLIRTTAGESWRWTPPSPCYCRAWGARYEPPSW